MGREGMISVFVNGKLMNLKTNRAHWSSAINYKRVWRQKVKLAVRFAIKGPADTPKTITLAANVWNLFDEQDGLRAALSPVLDGLRDGGVIHDDGPTSGHTFRYAQTINRAQLGVEIAVVPSPTVGSVPISWDTARRISRDGP